MTMKLTFALIATLLLASCGTASGITGGLGQVFSGVGEDFKSLADTIRR